MISPFFLLFPQFSKLLSQLFFSTFTLTKILSSDVLNNDDSPKIMRLCYNIYPCVQDYDTAVLPRLVSLYLTLQLASYVINVVFQEYNGFKLGADKAPAQLFGESYAATVKFASFAALTMAAFGGPSFTSEDDPTQYLCLVPLVPALLIYRSTVSASPSTLTSSVVCNGGSTLVKEPAVDATDATDAAEAPATDAPAEEPATDAPATVDASATDASAVEDATANKEDPAANSSVEEITMENKEEDQTINGDVTAEKNAEKAPCPVATATAAASKVLALLSSLYCCAATRACSILAPVLGFTTVTTSVLLNLPWARILMLLSTSCSHLLLPYAWYTLTSNLLVLLFPLLGLLLPLLATRLPSPWTGLGSDLLVAGTFITEYILVSDLLVL